MARRYFPGQNPIGETFRISGWSREPLEIVGVVPDSKYRTLREQAVPTFYVHPSARPTQFLVDVMFEVRQSDPATALPRFDRLISQIDPEVHVVEPTAMDAVIDFTLGQERLAANLASTLGLRALLLAAVGLYGVTAFAVAQPTSEIGIRMAVGARPVNILALVLRRSSVTTILGVALGLAGAAAITWSVEALLFGVAPIDPMTFVAVALLFGVTVMLAAFFPARRATRVDPLLALRCE
jgi:hypothetical protein